MIRSWTHAASLAHTLGVFGIKRLPQDNAKLVAPYLMEEVAPALDGAHKQKVA
jgi:hypothetical protein